MKLKRMFRGSNARKKRSASAKNALRAKMGQKKHGQRRQIKRKKGHKITKLRRDTKRIIKVATVSKRIKPLLKTTRKERVSKKNDVSLKVLTPETVESLKKDTIFTEYVNGKIGKRADEVILSLAAPVTDEALAEKLGMKINDTRRVLNMLNTDGVARYIVNKNSKGWLTFKWYIDEDNLKKMRGEVALKVTTNSSALPENCNDYYVCAKCYSKTKLVYPFEVGYEMNFKCDVCGSFFVRKSKEDIESMLF